VKAYCAPGMLPVAEFLLALHGDKPDALAEHPWLEGITGVILIADLPELEQIDLPFMTTAPPPRREPPLSLPFPLRPSPMLTVLP
jgi:hypothetical protein